MLHYATLDEVVAWLAGHDGELQCVVTGCLPHSRRAGFGSAQSPALTIIPTIATFLRGLRRWIDKKCYIWCRNETIF